MSDLPSVKQKVQTESTRYLSSVSEFLVQTAGKSINWLIDRVDALDTGLAGQTVSKVTGITQSDTAGGSITYTAPLGKLAFVTLTAWNNAGASFTVDIATPFIGLGTFTSNVVGSGRAAPITVGAWVPSLGSVTIGNATSSSGVPKVYIQGLEYYDVNLTVP